MRICICSGTRFKEDILKAASVIDDCVTPELSIPKESETPEMVPRLVFDHLSRIKSSDAILVIDPSGYIGSSVKIEIGYAEGLGKKIFFTEKTGSPELDCLADAIIPMSDLILLNKR